MTISWKLRRLFLCAAVVAAAFWVMPSANAQQKPSEKSLDLSPTGSPNAYYGGRGPRGVGGYSMTFGDIWGPAKMPPAPRDFGPHFDYPPESLNSTPLHDPYPN